MPARCGLSTGAEDGRPGLNTSLTFRAGVEVIEASGTTGNSAFTFQGSGDANHHTISNQSGILQLGSSNTAIVAQSNAIWARSLRGREPFRRPKKAQKRPQEADRPKRR